MGDVWCRHNITERVAVSRGHSHLRETGPPAPSGRCVYCRHPPFEDGNLIGLIGVVVLPVIAWLVSRHRAAINWRTVGAAFALQAGFGALVLYLPAGEAALGALAGGVARLLEFSRAGSEFVFGELASDSLGFIFAFQVLPIIVFFASLISVLYHLGIMQWVVRSIGGLLRAALGTSRPESLTAASNIFVGLNEAPLVVRPFVPTMTASELFAVMTGGLATIAGSIMGGYAAMGIELTYLIAACFMAAPGALMMAKIVMPEVDRPREDLHRAAGDQHMRSVNLIDAAATGALTGLRMAAAVAAMVIAFVALIALLNGLTGWLGSLAGAPELSIEQMLGWLFRPIAWMIGIPWEEAGLAGRFIGQKLVTNEFVAYLDFLRHREALAAPTQAIVTFALCGFANFGSVAILIGGLGVIAQERREDIARFGLRALLAASLANLMSAALAGVFLGL